MFNQYVYFAGAAVGPAFANVTLQTDGTLYAVQYGVNANLTLGAADGAYIDLEASLLNTLTSTSQMSPPNGVLSKAVAASVCDVAGTSIVWNKVADELVMVVPRRFQQGQIIYLNAGYIVQNNGGVATLNGFVNLMFK